MRSRRDSGEQGRFSVLQAGFLHVLEIKHKICTSGGDLFDDVKDVLGFRASVKQEIDWD